MIDKVSGHVNYAIMSFGGFLGIGDRYHPLPWSVLKFEIGRGGYVVNFDKSQLENAPSYSSTATIDWETEKFGDKINNYYRSEEGWGDGS